MGKVRTAMVKRTARRLLSMYPSLFTDSFEKNKELVRKLVDIPSKRVQNRIAGYVTRLVKISKTKEAATA